MCIRDSTYSDLVDSNRCEFLVLAAGTGGRWHEDCIRLVTALARYRAASESVGGQNFGKMLLVFGCIGSDFCK